MLIVQCGYVKAMLKRHVENAQIKLKLTTKKGLLFVNMKKAIKIYVVYNKKHNITMECTEKYLNNWLARGFVVKEIKENKKE